MNNGSLKDFEREPFLREFEKLVDVTIDNQQDLPARESTVIDMTGDTARIVREGLGIEEALEVFRMQGETLEEA